jgi:hypothetical protein
MGDVHYLHQNDPIIEREELLKAFRARLGVLLVKALKNGITPQMMYAHALQYLTKTMEMDPQMEEVDRELIRGDLERYILHQRDKV